jgi:hypothetical protein
VRVVTLDASGTPTGNPSGPVEIAYGPPQPEPKALDLSAQHTDPPMVINIHVTGFTPWYQPTADDAYYFIVTRESFPYPWRAGQHLYLPPQHHDESWLDDVVKAFGDFVNAVASVVEWVIDEYKNIKADVVRVIVDVVKDTIGCGEVCQDAINWAIDTGLAALGLPPTLPDFGALVSDGEDYLAGLLASEIGLPQDVAKKGFQALVAKAEEAAVAAAATGSDGRPAPLFIPDPDHQYRPPQLTIRLSNPRAAPLSAGVLNVRDSQHVWKTKSLPTPPLSPGQTLTFTVALEPDYMYAFEHENVPDDMSSDVWQQRYLANRADMSFDWINESSGPDGWAAEVQITTQTPFTAP